MSFQKYCGFGGSLSPTPVCLIAGNRFREAETRDQDVDAIAQRLVAERIYRVGDRLRLYD